MNFSKVSSNTFFTVVKINKNDSKKYLSLLKLSVQKLNKDHFFQHSVENISVLKPLKKL